MRSVSECLPSAYSCRCGAYSVVLRGLRCSESDAGQTLFPCCGIPGSIQQLRIGRELEGHLLRILMSLGIAVRGRLHSEHLRCFIKQWRLPEFAKIGECVSVVAPNVDVGLRHSVPCTALDMSDDWTVLHDDDHDIYESWRQPQANRYFDFEHGNTRAWLHGEVLHFEFTSA
ncbi:uncharacterized protein EI97DRAFT_119237 [Westerdykella ornata]|uniref:Uncharacterized protein n=1 Tax=Westerdykella ornata TaxID=318751 RepID=A0A6A6JW50_WESOR|nr:uncharacterized protein EI97DRAFT_119237 [Westerdykella ornata]KAF2280323.1 hypothetical protein EI97DRAFT_119237 [Westerdykella ornata]